MEKTKNRDYIIVYPWSHSVNIMYKYNRIYAYFEGIAFLELDELNKNFRISLDCMP